MFSTGIEYEHEEFEGRAFYGGYDITGHEGRNCFSDSWGTVVASLAAGKTVGVAKKAKVYRYRRCTNTCYVILMSVLAIAHLQPTTGRKH